MRCRATRPAKRRARFAGPGWEGWWLVSGQAASPLTHGGPLTRTRRFAGLWPGTSRGAMTRNSEVTSGRERRNTPPCHPERERRIWAGGGAMLRGSSRHPAPRSLAHARDDRGRSGDRGPPSSSGSTAGSRARRSLERRALRPLPLAVHRARRRSHRRVCRQHPLYQHAKRGHKGAPGAEESLRDPTPERPQQAI